MSEIYAVNDPLCAGAMLVADVVRVWGCVNAVCLLADSLAAVLSVGRFCH